MRKIKIPAQDKQQNGEEEEKKPHEAPSKTALLFVACWEFLLRFYTCAIKTIKVIENPNKFEIFIVLLIEQKIMIGQNGHHTQNGLA